MNKKKEDAIDKNLMTRLMDIRLTVVKTLRLAEALGEGNKEYLKGRLKNIDKVLDLVIERRVERLKSKKNGQNGE